VPLRRIRLGTILAFLVLATTVPLGLFAAGLVWTSWNQQRALVDRQNVETARAVSAAIDEEVETTIASLSVLASVDSLDDENLQRFYKLTKGLLVSHPTWQAIRLFDPSGKVVLSTDVPFGEPASLVNPDLVNTVRTTLRPAVATLRQDPQTKEFLVPIGVPVIRGGGLLYVLYARVRATAFSDTIHRQAIPPPGVVTLLDSNGLIIARSRNEERYIGQRPHPSFTEARARMSEGSWRSVVLEGTPSYSALSRSARTGLTVGIALPADAIDGPIRRSFAALTAAGAVTLGAGLVLALLLRRRIVRSQLAAATAARRLAAGEPMTLRHTAIAEIEELSVALRDAAAILERRLRERNEALIAEREARAVGEKNEARLAVTLHSIGDAVITTDPNGRITMLNTVAQELTGWTEAAAIGEPIDRVFATIDEHTRQRNEGPFARVMAERSVAGMPEHALLVARDGREIPVDDSAAPILGADGTLVGAVVVFRDVTAQRDAERQRAAVLDREQAARRAAEALSRAKDEFVATVSHELRTPLNAILGWVTMLRSGSLDGDRQQQQHAFGVIDRNARAQAQLIEDLLDMSRMIRGDVRLEMEPIDMANFLEAAVDSLRPTAEAKQISLILDTEHGLALVSADQNRMQQILFNVLSNAMKFTPPGGRIEARLAVERDEVVVRVVDTGEGIAPEFLPHVFDRFRQESSDVTRRFSGLGVGLSLVRYLTELHGGTISAESPGKGQGATFTIRLPLLGGRPAQTVAGADYAASG
jgi:PAS domain S-box-containing protein